ncbi:hypothetical protein EON68_02795, partial [archaeon]
MDVAGHDVFIRHEWYARAHALHVSVHAHRVLSTRGAAPCTRTHTPVYDARACVRAAVLSTQALLYAVGLGAGSIPVAAALNWVIKDGLGQLGGVLSAALINNRFDADPKKWRYTSAMLLDISTLLEILTPLAPAAFVPLGALANVGKNISWLAASATRAGMHQTLAINGNLADVTAKAGSQTIAASTAGTVIGVALSPLIGSGATNILIAFLVLSFLHQLCVHLGLQRMVLPTLSAMRLASATAPLYSAIAPLAATPAAFS